jgi:aldehyde dehydrogenase family protein
VAVHPDGDAMPEFEVPLFRRGLWYRSLDLTPVAHARGALALAPAILVRDDLAWLGRTLPRVAAPPVARRARLLREALGRFRTGRAEIGGLGAQSSADFAAALRNIVGLPPVLTSRWSTILLAQLETLIARPSAGTEVDALVLVSLPSNTFLCLEAGLAAALSGKAVWLRPSSREPLAAARLIACLLAAGWPPERLGYYPSSRDVLTDLVRGANQSVLFGGNEIQRAFGRESGVEVRGPGRACAIVDVVGGVESTAEWLLERVAGNGGRLCTNVGTIVCVESPFEIGLALARRLDELPLAGAEADYWPVPSWPNPELADRVAHWIEERLRPGDLWLTRRPIRQIADGRAVLAPGLVSLAKPFGHPLIGVEVPFPFAVLAAASRADAARLTERSRFVARHLEQ